MVGAVIDCRDGVCGGRWEVRCNVVIARRNREREKRKKNKMERVRV